MGFNGQPSQGCAPCRKRRIGCDRRNPVCGQCVRSNRECSGYRDPNDLLFVNLTQSTKARAMAKRGTSRSSSLALAGTNQMTTIAHGPQTLLERPEIRALGYFMNDFVFLSGHHDSSRGFMEHIQEVYTGARVDSSFMDAISAIALIVYGHHVEAPNLVANSHTHYAKAVRKLQQAITDTEQAKSNETLMSILVLGLFDAMVATEETMFDWSHHADGAAVLVKLRGSAEMLSHPISKRIYWAVRNHSIYNNCIKYEPLEPFLDWESLWVTPVISPPDTYAIKLIAMCERIPALRHAAYRWLKTPISGVAALKCVEIMGNCKIMDDLLQAWSFEMPHWLRPRWAGIVEGTMIDPNNTILYPGRLEIYQDLFYSSLWNMWRTFRIVCQTMIVNCCERLYAPPQLLHNPDYVAAASIIQEMADGVCAGVPYHLGYWKPAYGDAATKNPSIDGSGSKNYKNPEKMKVEAGTSTASALYLVMTCFFTCSAITIPSKQRAWLRARLTWIAGNTGCAEAEVLAKVSASDGRQFSITDFDPPKFEEYRPEMASLLTSPVYLKREAAFDSQVTTSEAHKLRAWRRDFLLQLLVS